MTPAQHPLFDLLTEEERADIIQLCATHNFAKGSHIIREDSPGRLPFFIVLAGSIEVRKRANDGTEHIIARLEAPTMFGEIEAFAGLPASAEVLAQTAVETMIFTRNDLERLVREGHTGVLKIAHAVACTLARRLADTNEKLAAVLHDRPQDLSQFRQDLFASWSRKQSPAD